MTDGLLSLVSSQAVPEPESPFDALMHAAESDPEAARGLAAAYASMSAEERAGLIATVIRDAARAHRSARAPLSLLLSVEDEPERARAIATALADAGAADPRARAAIDAGWIHGDERTGGTGVVRHLFGDLVEVVYLSVADGQLRVRSEPLARRADVATVRAGLGIPSDARAVPFDEAVDRMAEALWRHRRRAGALPEPARALTDIFTTARRA